MTVGSGGDVTEAGARCHSCGATVQGDWAFCARCGARRPLAGAIDGAGLSGSPKAERPCALCGQHAGDVYAIRRADGARVLVCYRCYGAGLDEGTLVDQMNPLAYQPTPAVPPQVTSPGSFSAVPGERNRGDLAWGFIIGFFTGLIGILIMRLALSVERRRDKIYGAWFGWIAGFAFGIALITVSGG